MESPWVKSMAHRDDHNSQIHAHPPGPGTLQPGGSSVLPLPHSLALAFVSWIPETPLPLLPSKPPWAHVFKCRLSGMTVTTQESRCCPLGFFSLKDSLKPNSRGSCTQRRLVGVTHHHPWPPWSGESGHNHPYHAVGISGGPPFSAGAPRAPEDPLLAAPSPAGTQKGKNSGSQCTRRAGKVRQESK